MTRSGKINEPCNPSILYIQVSTTCVYRVNHRINLMNA
jgi:hypothetical protein